MGVHLLVIWYSILWECDTTNHSELCCVIIPLPCSTLRLGKKQKSSDKKVLLTAGTDWPDPGDQVPLSPLPTAQDSPPASTEAVVMANEGAVDASTDPAPPTQM